MGHKTGVYFACYVSIFLRGITIGVIGTTSLAISARSGVPQNNLIAARGLGLMAAPVIFSSAIGRLLRAGQVFRCVSGALAIKAACELCVAARGACGPSLYAVFFAMGIGIGVLDTTADLVVTTVHGERCAVPLNVINALYGTGGMLAPFFALAAGDGAWHVLALADLALAAAVAARRLGRGRPGAALPGAALAGIGPAGDGAPGASATSDAAKGLAPMRVLVPALAFLVLAQAAETAVSAWGFTLAVSRLGLSSAVAARFPAVFYFSFTAARFAVVPASARVAPSALVRGGTLLAFCGALALLAALGGADGGGADAGRVRRLLACFALLGAGTCPMYAMVLASIRQHGQLGARQVGWYRTCSNIGNTMGMWVPGVVSLPRAELAWTAGMLALMACTARDFPWRRRAAEPMGPARAR